MLAALYAVGFKRVGIYFAQIDGKQTPTHIHVDVDTTKDQDVAWLTKEL
jgi:hypothetical protein